MSASTRTTYTSSAGSIAVDSLTKQILTVANKLLALEKFGGEEEPMTATQGSYRPYTSYSGSTHTGCAAVDLTAWNWQNRIKVLDLLGIIGCHRTPQQGNWPYHIHAMTNGMGCAATSLKGQITEVMAGGDGLSGSRPDPDRSLRSLIWPLGVYQGRTGVLQATRATRLFDGPSSEREVLRAVPLGEKVVALMEVRNNHDNIWFVTSAGEWGFSGKWELDPTAAVVPAQVLNLMDWKLTLPV